MNPQKTIAAGLNVRVSSCDGNCLVLLATALLSVSLCSVQLVQRNLTTAPSCVPHLTP